MAEMNHASRRVTIRVCTDRDKQQGCTMEEALCLQKETDAPKMA